jgi:hypothetical protein
MASAVWEYFLPDEGNMQFPECVGNNERQWTVFRMILVSIYTVIFALTGETRLLVRAGVCSDRSVGDN